MFNKKKFLNIKNNKSFMGKTIVVASAPGSIDYGIQLYCSDDLTTFTRCNIDIDTSKYNSNGGFFIKDIISNGKEAILVIEDRDRWCPCIYRTTDGINWTSTDIYSAFNTCSFYFNNEFVVKSENDQTANISKDGITWTETLDKYFLPTGFNYFKHIDNYFFIYDASLSLLYYSLDCFNWSYIDLKRPMTSWGSIYKIDEDTYDILQVSSHEDTAYVDTFKNGEIISSRMVTEYIGAFSDSESIVSLCVDNNIFTILTDGNGDSWYTVNYDFDNIDSFGWYTYFTKYDYSWSGGHPIFYNDDSYFKYINGKYIVSVLKYQGNDLSKFKRDIITFTDLNLANFNTPLSISNEEGLPYEAHIYYI